MFNMIACATHYKPTDDTLKSCRLNGNWNLFDGCKTTFIFLCVFFFLSFNLSFFLFLMLNYMNPCYIAWPELMLHINKNNSNNIQLNIPHSAFTYFVGRKKKFSWSYNSKRQNFASMRISETKTRILFIHWCIVLWHIQCWTGRAYMCSHLCAHAHTHTTTAKQRMRGAHTYTHTHMHTA